MKKRTISQYVKRENEIINNFRAELKAFYGASKEEKIIKAIHLGWPLEDIMEVVEVTKQYVYLVGRQNNLTEQIITRRDHEITKNKLREYIIHEENFQRYLKTTSKMQAEVRA